MYHCEGFAHIFTGNCAQQQTEKKKISNYEGSVAGTLLINHNSMHLRTSGSRWGCESQNF